MQIQKVYLAQVATAQESDQTDPNDPDTVTQAEISATVEAVIQLHKLVSEGKVPFHLLDFEALDMDVMTANNDDNDESSSNNAEPAEGNDDAADAANTDAAVAV